MVVAGVLRAADVQHLALDVRHHLAARLLGGGQLAADAGEGGLAADAVPGHEARQLLLLRQADAPHRVAQALQALLVEQGHVQHAQPLAPGAGLLHAAEDLAEDEGLHHRVQFFQRGAVREDQGGEGLAVEGFGRIGGKDPVAEGLAQGGQGRAAGGLQLPGEDVPVDDKGAKPLQLGRYVAFSAGNAACQAYGAHGGLL